MNSSENKTNITELNIGGAGCASCVGKIESAICEVEGVSSAHMNFADRTVSVEGDVDPQIVIASVERIGYTAQLANNIDLETSQIEKETSDKLYYKQLMRDMWLALGLGVPLMLYGIAGGEMTVSTKAEQLSWLFVGVLTLVVMFVSGRRFYIGAWRSLLNHTATMDTLIAMGTGAAWLYSITVVLIPNLIPEVSRHIYFEASAMIIGLINLGLALEVRARGRTSEAIKRLIGLQAKTARLIVSSDDKGEKHTEEIDVPISKVSIGDNLRVRPGEKVPVDADVIDGSTTIDESMLTGEPIPVEKKPGDKVSAGSINKVGSIVIKATAVGEHTALSNIIAMVKQAQNSRPAIGRIADTISAYFVPSVLIISILSALVWLNFGPSPSYAYALVAATTVLIIACPCALGLATPMSIMVGVGKAAEFGVLIRNGEALQTGSKISTMVLDKTGTITLGEPRVTQIVTAPDFSEDDVLRYASAVEKGSEHPLAQAIIDCAKERNIDIAEAADFLSISGKGVSGRVAEDHILFGNRALMDEYSISLSTTSGQDFLALSSELAEEAKTPMYLAVNKKLAGIIAVSDPIKEDSIAAINRLKQLGIKPVMLTGDNQLTAKAVAKAVGIEEFIAEVLPDQKAEAVSKFQSSGEVVGMVGDGINDAPALATADVGFAIGTGTDVAIESADITLMRGSLHGLVDAISVSKAIIKNIRQNMLGAFLYNTLGIPVAAGLFFPVFGAMLNPVVAGAAMAFSSVTVVTNANRLRFFKP